MSTSTTSSRWPMFVVAGALAVAAFSVGHFWTAMPGSHGSESMSTPRDGDKKTAINQGDPGGMSAAPANPRDGAKPLWTCSMHPQVIQDHPGLCPICHMELTPLKLDATGDNTITINPAIVQNMGVRTAVVSTGALIQTVRAVGYLTEPEPLHRDINLRVNGWIEKLYANIDGMAVKEGEPLFDLYSPELTIAADELISARKQLASVPDDVASKLMLDTSQRKLIQLGLTEAQVAAISKLDAAPHTIPILSPLMGHVTAKMVYEGAAVKAGDLVMRIASRHEMWIEAQVYEQQLGLISEGQPVRATVVSQPGKVFAGKVMFVHPHLDAQTRTALVRIGLSNADHSLRENMYATVDILADNYKEAVVVPREAIIDSGRRQVAFVSLGSGRFEPRELQLGTPGENGTVQVLSGLKAGETVVTSGQFLLDSESRLKESLAKYLHAGPVDASAPNPQTTTQQPPPAPLPAPTTTPLSPPSASTMPMEQVDSHIDDLARAYLAVSRSLGERQQSDTPLNIDPLLSAAHVSAEASNDETKSLAAQFAAAVSAMQGQPIERQRELFVKVGVAARALLKQSPPSSRVAQHLYIFECPMAFHLGNATWIQDSDQTANPFFPVEMKKCGSVVEQINPTR